MNPKRLEEPRSYFYQSQRLRLHYVVWGNEGKPPLLLVHGGRDHCRSWDFVAQAFRDRYTIYAPDLRGHGDSDWAVGGLYSLPEFVLDVGTLANTMPEPLTIIGHSMGGAIALQYAGTFPGRIAKVVAIEGLGPPMEEARPAHIRMREWVAQMHDLERRQPRNYVSQEDATRRMMEENPHLTPEMARHLTLRGTLLQAAGTYIWKFDNYVRIRGPYEFNLEEAQEIWAQIRAPVLLIKGAESQAPHPDESSRARVIPVHRTVVIEGAGHWAHHDQLDRFLELVEEFIAHG